MAVRRRRQRSPPGAFTAFLDQFGRRGDPVCGSGRRPDAGAGLSGRGGDQARPPQSRVDKIRAAGAADPYYLPDLAVAIGEGTHLHRSGGRGQRLAFRVAHSFLITRNVPFARAITTPSATTRLWAKQSVPPVLITSLSTESHWPICAVPVKSTARPTVTSRAPPPSLAPQL